MSSELVQQVEWALAKHTHGAAARWAGGEQRVRGPGGGRGRRGGPERWTLALPLPGCMFLGRGTYSLCVLVFSSVKWEQ